MSSFPNSTIRNLIILQKCLKIQSQAQRHTSLILTLRKWKQLGQSSRQFGLYIYELKTQTIHSSFTLSKHTLKSFSPSHQQTQQTVFRPTELMRKVWDICTQTTMKVSREGGGRIWELGKWKEQHQNIVYEKNLIKKKL